VAGIDAGPNEEARRARLKYIYDVAMGGGSLYVGSTQGFGIHRIRGKGEPELLGARGLGVAQIVCSFPAENLFVCAHHANIIQKVCIPNGETETVAGKKELKGFAGDSGPALEASFNVPMGVAVTPFEHTLYIADTYNQRIRRVLLGNTLVETIAGNGTTGYSGDRGPALSAQLNRPTFLELDWETRCLFFQIVEITAFEGFGFRTARSPRSSVRGRRAFPRTAPPA